MIGSGAATPFIAAVVLAAGGSTRMGRPKLALPVRGEPMIRRVARAAQESRCREVIVVLGTHAEIYRPLLDGLDVRIVMNTDPGEGMGSSIRVGVAAIAPEAAGVVILLADQPFVTGEIINRLLKAAVAQRRPIVASAYGNTTGPPVYFGREMFPALLALSGDQGARSVIEAHPAESIAVPIPDAIAVDVDTIGDLESIEPPEGGRPYPP
jgi:molybdenum cofactor cytidylyltransferase